MHITKLLLLILFSFSVVMPELVFAGGGKAQAARKKKKKKKAVKHKKPAREPQNRQSAAQNKADLLFQKQLREALALSKKPDSQPPRKKDAPPSLSPQAPVLIPGGALAAPAAAGFIDQGPSKRAAPKQSDQVFANLLANLDAFTDSAAPSAAHPKARRKSAATATARASASAVSSNTNTKPDSKRSPSKFVGFSSRPRLYVRRPFSPKAGHRKASDKSSKRISAPQKPSQNSSNTNIMGYGLSRDDERYEDAFKAGYVPLYISSEDHRCWLRSSLLAIWLHDRAQDFGVIKILKERITAEIENIENEKLLIELFPALDSLTYLEKVWGNDNFFGYNADSRKLPSEVESQWLQVVQAILSIGLHKKPANNIAITEEDLSVITNKEQLYQNCFRYLFDFIGMPLPMNFCSKNQVQDVVPVHVDDDLQTSFPVFEGSETGACFYVFHNADIVKAESGLDFHLLEDTEKPLPCIVILRGGHYELYVHKSMFAGAKNQKLLESYLSEYFADSDSKG